MIYLFNEKKKLDYSESFMLPTFQFLPKLQDLCESYRRDPEETLK